MRYLLRKLVPNYFFGAAWIFILCVFVSGVIWIRSTTNIKHLKAEFHKKFPVIMSSDGKTLITEDFTRDVLAYDGLADDAFTPPAAENTANVSPLVLEEEPPTIDEVYALLEQHAAEAKTMRAQSEANYAAYLRGMDELRQLKEEEKALGVDESLYTEEAFNELIFGGLSGDMLRHRKLIFAGRDEEAWELINSPTFGMND